MISLGFWIADTYEGDTVAVNRRGSKLKGNDYCEMGFILYGQICDRQKHSCGFCLGGWVLDTVGIGAGGCGEHYLAIRSCVGPQAISIDPPD